MTKNFYAFALLVLVTAFGGSIRATAAEKLPKIRMSPDGRSFLTADNKSYVPFGVNYYRPGTGWAPQVWKQFNAEATHKDFKRMKELGVNCVRVFLSYGSFCMDADHLSEDGLRKFDQFLQIAEENGIYVHPTGPDHWEGVADWAKEDRIAGETNLRALESFWKQFAGRYRGRTVIFSNDLRNEPEVAWDSPVMKAKWNQWLNRKYINLEQVAKAWAITTNFGTFGQIAVPEPKDSPNDPRLLDYQLFREDIADEWTQRQSETIKAVDPEALVTVGLIQWSVPTLLPKVQHYSGFRPSRQAKFVDFLEVHFYPFNNGVYEYADEKEEAGNLAYLESVVREVAKPGKTVVIGEFGWYGGGIPTLDGKRYAAGSEEQQARWCQKVIETTKDIAVGWLNWGLYDQPEATDVSQLTGLLKADGEVKAWGIAFKQFSAKLDSVRLQPRKSAVRPVIDWDLCITSAAAGNDYRQRYIRSFVDHR